MHILVLLSENVTTKKNRFRRTVGVAILLSVDLDEKYGLHISSLAFLLMCINILSFFS